MPTIVKAGSAIAGMEVSSSDDGLLVFRTSAAGGGSVVDALSIAADGTPTLIKPLPIASGGMGIGTGQRVVQMVQTQTGAVATGSTVIPMDDTIPQITEGDQYMSLAITPQHADNILTITVVANVSANVAEHLPVALFVGTTANALTAHNFYSGGNENKLYSFNHRLVAGVTSALTFRFRAGPASAGTTTFNGNTGVRRFGGVMLSSMTIVESTP